jgi:CRISPR-associated protein Cas1
MTGARVIVGGGRSCRRAVEWDVEPEQRKVDRSVLDFIKGHVFDPADFVIRNDGVCRLNPEAARMVVAKVSA